MRRPTTPEGDGLFRADLPPFGGNGLLIAAIACAHDATVVAHDVCELSLVAGLRVEDWET